MKKVIARIRGGLGNQLFCYAAARRLAIVNCAELVLDEETGFARDKEYRRTFALGGFSISARRASAWELMKPFERPRRAIAKTVAKAKLYEKRQYVEEETLAFDPRLLRKQVRGTVYLDGLWQSEKYFADIEGVLRSDLRVTVPIGPQNVAMSAEMRGREAVAIHIRWFDRPTATNRINNVSLDYYRRAVAYLESQTVHPWFYVFSDNIQAASQAMSFSHSRVTYVDHNHGGDALADFWLMSQCAHYIIANSTYSWWAAWIGAAKAGAKVVAPRPIDTGTVTAWGFNGHIPDRWVQL